MNRVWAGCQISSTRRCVAAGRACALSSRRRRADATVALVRLTVVWKWGAAASRWAPAACAVPLPLPALPPCSRRQRFFFSAGEVRVMDRKLQYFFQTKNIFAASSLLHTSSQCSTFSRCASSSTPPGEGRAARGTRQDARRDACAALDLRRRLCVRCANARRQHQALPWPGAPGRGKLGVGRAGAGRWAQTPELCTGMGADQARAALEVCCAPARRARRGKPCGAPAPAWRPSLHSSLDVH